MSLDELRDQNRELAQTIERMRKEFDENRTINKAVDESNKLPFKVEQLEKALKERDSKIKELILRNSKLNDDNKKLAEEIENAIPLKEANEKLTRELVSAKQEIRDHRRNVQQLNNVLRGERERQEQKDNEAREARDKMKKQNEKIIKLEEKMKSMSTLSEQFNRLKKKKIGNGAFDELMDQCSCAVCCEVFASAGAIPRVLDCGHTFCEICIGKLPNISLFNLSRISCPSCKAHTSKLPGRVLPTNFFAISLVEEALKAINNQRATCEVCEKLIDESEQPETSKQEEKPIAEEAMEE